VQNVLGTNLATNARKRRVRFSYPANFKNDVLLSLENSSARNTAKSLGIPLSTLYRWRNNSGRQPGQFNAPRAGTHAPEANRPEANGVGTNSDMRHESFAACAPHAFPDPSSKRSGYRFDRSVARHSRQVLERLMLVHDFVENRYFEHIDCHTLASIAGMSKCHFVRVYKQAIGESPYQHLIRRRAGAALNLLGVTLQPTLAIACAVGFESTSSLIKALKKFSATGIPTLIY
jgi:AraC-like DNA-binding protein/transposase-like protein